MSSDEFRKFGYHIVDWIADYFDNVEKFKVVPGLAPGEIKSKIPPTPPDKSETMAAIFRDFEKIILPGITHWQHPGWFAYFPANNSPASILGELLSAGLGVQSMVWQTSPAAEELEEVVLDWLRQMLGLPDGMVGVIQDTASTATLCALIAAREKATDFQVNETGGPGRLVVYASREAHSSVEKGVKVAGIGRKNLRLIPVDEKFSLMPDELERKITEDKKAGFIPACVVATIGTTSSGAVDPLRAIGEICQKHNIWLHVDAAYAGTAAVLPEKRWILDGAEHVDSFVFNPHKWMLTNFDCSAFFIRDHKHLVRSFEIHPEYLKTGVDAVVRNYRDWGIQLGRRFRALKLWFVIRNYGVQGIRDIVREHIRLAQMFKVFLEQDGRFEIAAPVDFSLVCFRLKSSGSLAEKNELNKKFHQEINAPGKIFLTHTMLNGEYTIRLVVGQRTTEERHVKQACDIILKAAETVSNLK